MKYVNIDVICAVVSSLIITLVLYYFNRNDETKIPLKTYVKTFFVSSMLLSGILYTKKKFLDKNPMFLSKPDSSVYQDNIATGDPTF